jgi:hypothetical protein
MELRLCIGFDKPEKEHDKYERYPYPCKICLFANVWAYRIYRTCVWVDPKYNLVYIFLSNRINPDGGRNLKLEHMEIRGKIEDVLYEAMG